MEDDLYISWDRTKSHAHPRTITGRGEDITITISDQMCFVPSGWRGAAEELGELGWHFSLCHWRWCLSGRKGMAAGWATSKKAKDDGKWGTTGNVLFLLHVQTASITKSHCPHSPGFGHQPIALLPLDSPTDTTIQGLC